MIYDYEALSFRVISVIRCSNKKGYFNVKGRPHAALSYRVSGIGAFEVEGEKLLSEAGDLFFVPAGAAYNVEYSDGETIVVHFYDCNYNLTENITVRDKQRLKEKFVELLMLWSERNAQNAIKSKLFDIFQDLSDGKYGTTADDVAAKAAEKISANFSSADFNIAKLCRELHVSGATLRRRFSKRYGISPKEYLIKQRLDRAFCALASGRCSVREACVECGFEDEKYFSRAVKAHFGKSPSQIAKTSYV